MKSDPPIVTIKSKLPFSRVVAICVLVLSVPVLYEQKLRRDVLVECSNFNAPETALKACARLQSSQDDLSAATLSLIHRHRMRAYLLKQETDAALHEAGLAFAADPDSEVPLQWKAWIYLRGGDYPAALRTIEQALVVAPDNAYSVKMRDYLSRIVIES